MKKKPNISNCYKPLLDILFPSICLTCKNLATESHILCVKCLLQVSKPDNILISPNHISKKFHGKIPIKYCFSFLKFEEGSKIRKLIHDLKYCKRYNIGILLGEIYGEIIKKNKYIDDYDLIVSIPLHPNKLKQRGYNQSDYIARGFAKALKIKYCDKTIIRLKHTKSQTLMLDKWYRWKNIQNSFKVINNISNTKILLVDDVITTGATLEACSAELLNNNPKEISIATLSYA